MANATVSPHQGRCARPFLDQSTFPATGGFVGARLCMEVSLPGKPTCCLPCPASEWLYPDSFKTYATVAEWLNVFGLALLVFMLVSYAVLPVSKTRSHYLSICLIISISFICIGFIIPLASQPEQCFNEITPNDMHSSLTCAFSGGLILAGGLCTAVWVCVRALSMNMQIVWDVIPGSKFLWFSHLVGWGVPAAFFAAMMAFTGVSFRFGNACHINHENALATFWGPLMGVVAIASTLQLWTFGYCIRVYLRSLWGMDGPGSSANQSNSGLPSYNASLRAQTARAVFQRLKKVLFLQWRGLGIVTMILVDVIFFSVTFVHVDRLAADALANYSRTYPWIYCLVSHPDDKSECLPLVTNWLVKIETIEAVLLLLALAGLQCFVMMTRPSLFVAWYELFQRKSAARTLDRRAHKGDMATTSKDGQVRVDRGQRNSAFEMQNPASSPPTTTARSSQETDRHILLPLDTKLPITTSQLSSPSETYTSPYARNKETLRSPAWHDRPGGTSPPTTMSPPTPAAVHASGHYRDSSDYFGALKRHGSPDTAERRYVPSMHSFSGVRPPSRQNSIQSNTWEARELYSRGGLGLNPPSEDGHGYDDTHSRGGLSSRHGRG